MCTFDGSQWLWSSLAPASATGPGHLTDTQNLISTGNATYTNTASLLTSSKLDILIDYSIDTIYDCRGHSRNSCLSTYGAILNEATPLFSLATPTKIPDILFSEITKNIELTNFKFEFNSR